MLYKFYLCSATGEQVWVALDLAAQEALFRLWGVGGADQPRVFPFHRRVQHPLLAKGNEEKGQDSSSSLLLDRVSHQPNHSLAEICGESGDGDESGFIED